MKNVNECGHCLKLVTSTGRDSEGFCCDCCSFWVHARCEGINQNEYKLWKKLGERAKFYCTVRNCEQVATQFFSSLGPIKEQVERNTHKLEDLEKKMLDNEDSIDRLNGTMDRKIVEAVESVTIEAIKSEVKDEVECCLKIENDRRYRARNIIIAGLQESSDSSADERKARDLEAVKSLMVGDLGLEVSDCNITQCIRLGKIRSQGPRLVKVRLPTEDAVMKVI